MWVFSIAAVAASSFSSSFGRSWKKSPVVARSGTTGNRVQSLNT